MLNILVVLYLLLGETVIKIRGNYTYPSQTYTQIAMSPKL